MSKKSRKRNKRLLALAGLITAGTLAAKSKRNKAIDTGVQSAKDDSGSDMLPITPKKKPAKVYQDDIMKGGKGVKYQRPDIKFGQVINKKGDVQTLKPFENSGLSLGVSNRKVDRTANAVNKANRDMSKGKLPPQLQNPGRTNITTDQGNTRNFFKNLGNTVFPKANFKSGGRVKGCGKALRGFGRAMKKGKK